MVKDNLQVNMASEGVTLIVAQCVAQFQTYKLVGLTNFRHFFPCSKW